MRKLKLYKNKKKTHIFITINRIANKESFLQVKKKTIYNLRCYCFAYGCNKFLFEFLNIRFECYIIIIIESCRIWQRTNKNYNDNYIQIRRNRIYAFKTHFLNSGHHGKRIFMRTDGKISATNKTPVDDVSHIVWKLDESKDTDDVSVALSLFLV